MTCRPLLRRCGGGSAVRGSLVVFVLVLALVVVLVVVLLVAARVVAVLVEFPAQLLHAGDNRIDVQWRLAARAGMSALLIGPSDQLWPIDDRARLLDHTLPQVMNVAGGALAGFLLLVWLLRRQEQAIGLFGVLWLMLSLRN